ncbi:MAG: hypothetical protein MUP74_05170, partial [Desulfobacterales bacterium]|nr:hypothetical protein [Desulfobacterales bacterium]
MDRFLSAHGAVVEARREVIEALLPESLATSLETPEYIRIARGSGPETDAAAGEVYPLTYGSVLLEKMIQVACRQVPLVACRLQFDYLKQQGFDRLIQDQFFFDGAVGQVTSSAEIRTEYLHVSCRYLAQSDEQKEGLIDLVFNLETGAPAHEMAALIGYAAKTYPTERQSLSLGDQQV